MEDITPQPAAPLTAQEQQHLADLEKVIERGMQTFLEVGQALAVVRDARLYRAEFPTFEAYCRERWQMTRRNANYLISAADVADSLGTTVPKPTSERQARALGKVPEDERAEVWQETLDRTNGKPTAKAIEEVASERAQNGQPLGENEAEDTEPEPDIDPTHETPQKPAQWLTENVTLDAAQVPQAAVDSLTPLEAAELQQRLQAAMEQIRDQQAQIHNLHTANDSELAQMNATIARLQGRLAGLEGENERLQAERDTAQKEIERQYQQMAKAPDAQEFERLQQENVWAHQKFTELRDLLQQSKKVRQDIHARADSAKKSPLAPGVHWLLDLVGNMARVLGD